jgi:NAD(P)-dependent dehydrogenase (short-subunit alcohol dehydrogenase family)
VRTPPWGAADIGDLTGRVALVTGANSGIGFETARALAGHGATVVLACRNQDKATEAAAALGRRHPGAPIALLALDLADLVSVRRAADEFRAGHDHLDLLINNAGVMGTPYRQTADGFELQMATNHLGHFALTGLLLDRLRATKGARVVTVSSLMHRSGRVPFDDVAGETIRNTWLNYGTSKLANLLFTAELNRRLRAGDGTDGPTDRRVLALAAHPGWTRSNLAGTGAAVGEGRIRTVVGRTVGRCVGQSARSGALPSLYAATSPDVESGQFIGPRYAFELFGPPTVVRPNRRARNEADAARLWDISEALTGVRYALPAAC